MTLEPPRYSRPILNPPRKTARPIRAQAGQTGAPRLGRPRTPIQTQRASRYASGGYASGALAKTFPLLKNHRDTENDSSTSRSRLRSENGRRRSARPKKKSAQNGSQ